MTQNLSALLSPSLLTDLTQAERAAFWQLPVFAPTPPEREALKRLTMLLNWDRYHCSSQHFRSERLVDMILAAQRAHTVDDSNHIPAPYGFLALHRLHRAASMGWKSLMDEKYFNFDKNSEHLGLGFLLNRRGALAKTLVKDGCHPALLFSKSWSGSHLPTPDEACSALVDASSSCSIDACSFLLGKLSDCCSDPAILTAALDRKARLELKGVWSERPGIANSAEARAARRAHFALVQLIKHKALPNDLNAAWQVCSAKVLSMGSKAPASDEPGKTFTDVEIRRMESLVSLAKHDDLQGFDAILPLCGLHLESDFIAGVPLGAQLGYSTGKYWTTRLVSTRSWLCAARALELGDNPWLCAGDGVRGHSSDSNPFTLLAGYAPVAHTPHAINLGAPNRFSAFALSFSRAALRDAETRAPGRGRALCVEAFEISVRDHRDLWAQPGSQSALAACESTLMSVMIKPACDDSYLSKSSPARTVRSRL